MKLYFLYVFHWWITDDGDDEANYRIFSSAGFSAVSQAERFFNVISGDEGSWRSFEGEDWHNPIIVERHIDQPLTYELSLKVGRELDETIPF